MDWGFFYKNRGLRYKKTAHHQGEQLNIVNSI